MFDSYLSWEEILVGYEIRQKGRGRCSSGGTSVITRFAVRKKNHDRFIQVISLRKQGHSYSEIMKITGIAKSTINCWITYAGLNLSQEHLQIQAKKRLENYEIGIFASRITRAKNKELNIQRFVQNIKKYLNDPFFVSGIIMYETEGSKGNSNSFSNSDFRLTLTYMNFLKKYFLIDVNKDLRFRIYIHEARKIDLIRIINFWSKKMHINRNLFKVSWKHNLVTKQRMNLDYVGQLTIAVRGVRYFTGKMLAISDIILKKYQKLHL